MLLRALGHLRRSLASAAVAAMRPDAIVVDYKPLGRGEELREPLERCRADGGCTVALGLWEVDDRPERLSQVWTDELVDEVARLYDLVLVYGDPDPRDVRIERLTRVGLTVHRTGLIGHPPAAAPAADLGTGYLLVTVGGGADGRAVLAGARAVVAMSGYSTVAEILGAGKPALLVPRTFPRVELLTPDSLEPGIFADAIDRLLEREPAPRAALTGAAEVAQILARSRAYA